MPRIAAAVTVVIVMGMCIGFNTVRYPDVWEMVAVAHQPPRPEKPAPELQSATFSGSKPAEEPAAPIAITDSSGTPFSSASVDPIPFPTVLGTANDEWSDETSASPENMASAMPRDSVRSFVSQDPGDVPRELPVEPADSYELASSEHGASGYGEREAGPVEASPSMKYASGTADSFGPDQSTSRDRLATANRRPLVPVAPAIRHQYNGTTVGGNRSAKFGVGSRRTARLDHRVQRLPPLDETWEPKQRTQEPADIDGPIPIYPSTHDH
jgi:hypothetical protein